MRDGLKYLGAGLVVYGIVAACSGGGSSSSGIAPDAGLDAAGGVVGTGGLGAAGGASGGASGAVPDAMAAGSGGGCDCPEPRIESFTATCSAEENGLRYAEHDFAGLTRDEVAARVVGLIESGDWSDPVSIAARDGRARGFCGAAGQVAPGTQVTFILRP